MRGEHGGSAAWRLCGCSLMRAVPLISRRAALGAAMLGLAGRQAGAQAPADDGGAGAALDTADFLQPGFAARFTTMPVFRSGPVHPAPARPLTDPDFQWTAGYIHAIRAPLLSSAAAIPGALAPAFSALPHELEVYPNGDAIVAGGHSPFSIQRGALVITAAPLPPALRPLIPDKLPKDFLSGAISSYPFAQIYGYFELRGRIPAGRGLWPAFWLVPADMSWPPEFDVMEVLGQDPTTLYTTTHSRRLPQSTTVDRVIHTTDLSRADHSFGLDWGPETVRYYLDRRLVFAHPTPADCHKPFFLIANLGVGGPQSWPGPPDATTMFPAQYAITAIRAWQRAAYV
jgi:hypothetical protein